MEKSYWDLFWETGDPEMYIKCKEGEKEDGTPKDDGRGASGDPCQKQ